MAKRHPADLARGTPTGATWGLSFRAGYVRRIVDDELDELVPHLPAVLLDGAKAVGKTETALQRAATVCRLDDPGQAQVARADLDEILSGGEPVLLDEWHRVPEVWDAVRRAVDADRRGGRFLLTGSPPFGDTATHSGAGRITGLRMRPLTLTERGARPTVSLADLLAGGGQAAVSGTSDVGLAAYVEALLASGLPGAQDLPGRALRTYLDSYLDRIVDREMEEAGLKVRRPETVRGWLRAYAAAVSTATSFEKVRDAASAGQGNAPPRSTVLPYIETLTALRVLDEVSAWTAGGNHLSRLTQRPKHHLADPAFAARLVGHSRDKLLGGAASGYDYAGDHPFLRQLFESLATLTVRVCAQAAEATVGHLRTRDSVHEVDLIVEVDDGRILAVEVKLAATVDDADVKHLRWLAGAVGDQLLDQVVLTTGRTAYRRRDGIAVVPLALLGP